MDKHLNNCDLNVYMCNFCFGNISIKEKNDHDYFCGSKTDKCTVCNKYVKLREMDFHISMDCHPEEIPISKQVDLNNIEIKHRRSNKIGDIGKQIFYFFFKFVKFKFLVK